MLKFKGQISKYCQLFPRLHKSRNYGKMADQFHQPDATPEELNLMNRRLQMKKALRQEYLRKLTDPHSTDPVLFDPMMQRYYSMHMTGTERFVPTFKNWCVYMLTTVIPVILLAMYFRHDREKFERKCRSGELGYKERHYYVM